MTKPARQNGEFGELQTLQNVVLPLKRIKRESIGCDRPVNYKTEALKDVLKSEYPKGVDVVYESIGGEMFETCVNSLAVKGRLIIIGYISGYESEKGFEPFRDGALPQKLLAKSASVRGFFLMNFESDYKEYLKKLIQQVSAGKLRSFFDLGESSASGPFRNIDSVVNAVEYLYSGKNKGKIVVELNDTQSNKL